MKTVGCWLFVICLTTTAFAQHPVNIDWGLTVGVSSTQLHFKESSSGQPAYNLSWDRSTDLTGGIFAEIRFAKVKWLSIRNDFTHRKYDATSNDYFPSGQTRSFGTVSASYLKYSLSLRAALTKTTLQPFLTAGISPSVLLSQSNSYVMDYGSTQQRLALIDSHKPFEFGFYGGAGINYNRITGEVRVETSNGLRPSAMTSPVNTVYVLLSYRLLQN